MNNTNSIFLLFVLFLTACGPSTKLTTSWKPQEVTPKSYEKLAVVVFLPSMSNRAILEAAVEGELKARGIKARATFDIFPLAGNKEVVSAMAPDAESLKALIRRKVAEQNIDALLAISLLDTQKEEHYVEGSSLSVSMPYYAYSNPIYGYSYYDYYAYAYSTVYDPGYYVSTTSYFLESNLYDIATEKLIWTGQTTTKDPDSVEKEAGLFGKIIASEIVNKEVVKQ